MRKARRIFLGIIIAALTVGATPATPKAKPLATYYTATIPHNNRQTNTPHLLAYGNVCQRYARAHYRLAFSTLTQYQSRTFGPRGAYVQTILYDNLFNQLGYCTDYNRPGSLTTLWLGHN